MPGSNLAFSGPWSVVLTLSKYTQHFVNHTLFDCGRSTLPVYTKSYCKYKVVHDHEFELDAHSYHDERRASTVHWHPQVICAFLLPCLP